VCQVTETAYGDVRLCDQILLSTGMRVRRARWMTALNSIDLAVVRTPCAHTSKFRFCYYNYF